MTQRRQPTGARGRRARERAFTLIELLVVVAIISLLAAMLLPTLAKARDRTRTAACQNNQRQLVTALFLYADEHEGHAPDVINRDNKWGPCGATACSPAWPWTMSAYFGRSWDAGYCPSDGARICMGQVTGATPWCALEHLLRFGSVPATDAAAAVKWPWSYALSYYLGALEVEDWQSYNVHRGGFKLDCAPFPDRWAIMTELGADPNPLFTGHFAYYKFGDAPGPPAWIAGYHHAQAGGRNFAFLDGHVAFVRRPTYSPLSSDMRLAYYALDIHDEADGDP